MMRRLAQLTLAGALLLAMVSLAAAQQTPQPVVRLGNFFEVGNEVFIHIIGAADIRYNTVHNYDFEDGTRDRAANRAPTSSSAHTGDSDLTQAELRFGIDARYQKNLTMQVLFEQQTVFDGNLIDDRHNNTNPGGTDVFGRGTSDENNGPHIERYWIDYRFPGTPLRMRVGADLWAVDQARLVADDDPRFALFATFGAIDLMAAAVVQFESQRIGLENDNDTIYYTFSGGYTLKPHRFQFDVVYFRDRFPGADTQAVGLRSSPLGHTGQKHDSVLLGASWTGQMGPVRALLQGNLVLGTARGGTANLPAGVPSGRDYDIFAGGVVAMVEADFGVVRPFVGVVFGSADGDPGDDELHGFANAPWQDVTLITGGSFFAHLDTSVNFAGPRDYSCPAYLQGLPRAGLARAPQNVGAAALAGQIECSHTTGNPINQRLGNTSHLGLRTTYSNAGTLVIPVGLRVFPVKGHELAGWYVYRGMTDSTLLEVAFAPELAADGRTSIGKTQIHEIGGFWLWTLNPHFDIRLSGNIAFLGDGFKDIAQLADCNLQAAGVQRCQGDDVALKAEARFRARF